MKKILVISSLLLLVSISVVYATVTITSSDSGDWCGPSMAGCSKKIELNLIKDPENMSCPELPPPPCTSNCGWYGGGGGGGSTGSE